MWKKETTKTWVFISCTELTFGIAKVKKLFEAINKIKSNRIKINDIQKSYIVIFGKMTNKKLIVEKYNI